MGWLQQTLVVGEVCRKDVVISKYDLLFRSYSVQDLEAHTDEELLSDIRFQRAVSPRRLPYHIDSNMLSPRLVLGYDRIIT